VIRGRRLRDLLERGHRGEFDEFEVRDSSGVPLARGVRDPSLPEPT